MWSAGTTVFAAAMTWRRRARPPISWRTLGRLLLSRVPLPAAMMAMAKLFVSIQGYGLTCEVRGAWREGRRIRELRWIAPSRDWAPGTRLPHRNLQVIPA